MPLIVPAIDDAPLSQGDILEDVRLYYTKRAWTDGGEAAGARDVPCLVLSRPCNCLHKETVIVAKIEAYKDHPPKDLESLEDIQDFLTVLRDGGESPDCFYVGQIVGHSGRRSARLDSIHTIEVPPAGSIRDEWLKAKRHWRLSEDFRRDLHLRILRAFASLGFDDISWFSTSDLKWLVEAGRRDVASATEKYQSQAMLKANREALSQKFDSQNLDAAKASLDDISAKLKPLEAEYLRRLESEMTARPAI
jgi:hypothetical protein